MARGREAGEREEKLIITEDLPARKDIIVSMILITSKRTQVETVSLQVRELKLKQFQILSQGNTVKMNSDLVQLHCPHFFLCYNRKSFQIP